MNKSISMEQKNTKNAFAAMLSCNTFWTLGELVAAKYKQHLFEVHALRADHDFAKTHKIKLFTAKQNNR